MISAELDEAVRYARRIEATAADDQGTWRGGEWLRARSLPLVYDANRIVVLEHGFGMSMEDVSAAADEIQAGMPNRIVEFVECAESAALADSFRSAGWLDESLGFMVRHRAPDRHVDTSHVRLVDEAAMRAGRDLALNAESWASPAAVAQVREKQERVGRGVPTTLLGIFDDGVVVSYCEVYELDDVAQIEAVATVPTHRHRGYARAVVSRALELTNDRRLVFLNMDPNDWPQQLYAKLGLDEVGRAARFRRALLSSQ